MKLPHLFFVLLCSCLCLLFLPFSFAQLYISEVMYDPGQCSDTFCEWVELYNNATGNATGMANLTGCQLNGKALSGQLPPQDYLIVARNSANFTAFFGQVPNLIQAPISLSNSGATITLSGNQNCTDQFNYTSLTSLANGNNLTLERRQDNSWGESRIQGGTPGKQNSIWNTTIRLLDLEISEIMPNSFNGDEELKPNGEWVELHNIGNTEIYLGGLLLQDKDGHKLYISDTKIIDSSKGLYLPPGKYLVIYRDGDSDFTLNDNGYEEVSLIYNNQTIDLVSYSDSTEGMSWSKIEGNWYLTAVTPAEENKISGDCDWFLLLDLNSTIWQPQNFYFEISALRSFGATHDVTVRGRIEDTNGNIIETYAPWTNASVNSLSTKRYSPNLAEGIYQISFWFENMSCTEVDPVDNNVSRIIAISPTYRKTTSTINIDEVKGSSGNATKWGDQVLAQVTIYKGDETKQVVEAYAQKNGVTISERTKLNLYDSFKSYPLTLPIQLLPNCDNSIEDGPATLIVEGLDARAEKEFEIKGINSDVCTDYFDYAHQVEKENAPKLRYLLTHVPTTVNPGKATPTQLQILNEDQAHHFTIWSYVYRGNKCYSCEDSSIDRDANAQTLSLDSGEARIIDTFAKLDSSMKEGEYTLKVEIKKDNLKTTQSLTTPIYVQAEKEDKNRSQQIETNYSSSLVDAEENTVTPEPIVSIKDLVNNSKGIIIYEASGEKTKKLIPVFLAVSFALLCAVVLWKKK